MHAKHHGKVMRGIPWDGLGRGKIVASGSGANAAKAGVLKRNGSGGGGIMDLGKSGPGWKEVEERTFVAASAGGRGGRVRVRVIECGAGYGGAKVRIYLSCASANHGRTRFLVFVVSAKRTIRRWQMNPSPLDERNMARFQFSLLCSFGVIFAQDGKMSADRKSWKRFSP